MSRLMSKTTKWQCAQRRLRSAWASAQSGWLCWGLTSQSTIFQSCRDGAIASWVINQYFRGVKCLAQGHNTATVGLKPRTSRSGVRHSTTEPPRSPRPVWSEPLQCAQWVAKDPSFLHTDSEDGADAQTDLSLCWEHMPFCWFSHEAVQIFFWFEPPHGIMALFIFRQLILQTCMCSHPVGLDVQYLVKFFVYFHERAHFIIHTTSL